MLLAIASHNWSLCLESNSCKLLQHSQGLFNHNGSTDFFQQKEGFAQGCPLGPTFASLGLHIPLTKTKNKLQLQAASCLANHASGDDAVGSLGSSMSCLDDTNASLHHADIIPVLDLTQLEGPPLGMLLNCGKTKLMTTATGLSITHCSQPNNQQTILL